MVESKIQVEVNSLPDETVDFFNGDELRIRVFLDKYALRDRAGNIVERTPIEMWQRVARELASVEEPEKRKEWERKFYWLLKDFKFVPGGRIMFGAGQPRKATLLNCYVIPIKEDSIEGIFEWCKEAARTYSYGGGAGVDLSVLRPKGSPVSNAAIYSTGSVSFMELLSTTTGTIGQSGRRGALMITLRVDHPDILEFIEVKKDLSKINYANISVRVTDEFMKAVEKEKEFTLWYKNEVIGRVEKKVEAGEIWDRLIKAAWESAEPGVIFWDTLKRESTTEYNKMEALTTNPCSEVPLEPYGCCDLGSINLSAFVKGEFTKEAKEVQPQLDWKNLEKALRYGVRLLDNVLDYSADKHPLPQQSEASLWSRRIGVGFTGLGDMFVKLGLKYDSEEAIKFADDLFNKMKNVVYDESAELAAEKGQFPAFDLERHLKSSFIKRLDKGTREKIERSGLRNAALLTVPPVGSGSVLAGTSSGIEPIFSLSYLRKSQSLNKKEFKVYHPLVKEYMERFDVHDKKELPQIFVTAHQTEPEMRVRMQATIQRHIDHAISSTLNLPKDTTVEEVASIYFQAWKSGCKGITVYREGSRAGILLTEKEIEVKPLQPQEAKERRRPRLAPRPRPKAVKGKTYKMKTEMGNLYVTVNEDEQGPVEVFANLGKSGSPLMAFTEAVTRLISLALRSGVKPSAIIDQLSLIRSTRPVMQEDGEVVFSVPDAIAKAMAAYLQGGEQLKLLNNSTIKPVIQNPRPPSGNDNRELGLCPSCGGILIFTGGCYICRDCGFTKCD